MTVVALAIEPGAVASGMIATTADKLGLRLVDHRRRETEIAECCDADAGVVHRFAGQSPTTELHRALEMETLAVAARGDTLIVGCSAGELLRSFQNVVRVLIRAPIHYRELNIMRQLAFSDVQTARWEVESADGLLARFMRRFFAVDWLDERHYDLVLDAELIPDTRRVELIGGLASRMAPASGAPADLIEHLRRERRQDLDDATAEFDSRRMIVLVRDAATCSPMGPPIDEIADAERCLFGRDVEETCNGALQRTAIRSCNLNQ